MAHSLTAVVSVVALCAMSPAHALDSLELPGPCDDAYHYRYFANGEHDENYIEWWYFNLYDVEQDVQAIFSYSIVDPENHSGNGMSNVGVITYTPDGIIAESDTFSTEMFHGSYYEADVDIGSNEVRTVDRDTYAIHGSIANGLISWDLTYTSRAEPWFSKDRGWVGIMPWERMSWLVYMPAASVSGTLEIDGRSYAFDGINGYHDHNWGEWVPINVMWNWFQFSESEFSLEVGDFMLHPAGILSVEFQGERTDFLKLHYQVLHTRWQFDWEQFKLVPKKTWLLADNGDKRLMVAVETIQTEGLRMSLPVPLAPDVIIYEQTAGYSGGYWSKNADDGWDLEWSLDGEGFKEYTVRKWLE